MGEARFSTNGGVNAMTGAGECVSPPCAGAFKGDLEYMLNQPRAVLRSDKITYAGDEVTPPSELAGCSETNSDHSRGLDDWEEGTPST